MIRKFSEIKKVENDHERLIILRRRLNKTQHQFAKDLGVSPSYIGQIENYKHPFTDRLKERIDNFLRQENKLYEKDIFSNIR